MSRDKVESCTPTGRFHCYDVRQMIEWNSRACALVFKTRIAHGVVLRWCALVWNLVVRCCGFGETVCGMAFYSLMNCDYCGGDAISFCKGERCGQNNELHKFLCDDCVRMHQVCRYCQDVIRTDAQTDLIGKRMTEVIDLDNHMNIISKGLRQCAHCGSRDTSVTALKSCGACERAFYCDSVCQKDDWKRHKLFSCFGEKKICSKCKDR